MPKHISRRFILPTLALFFFAKTALAQPPSCHDPSPSEKNGRLRESNIGTIIDSQQRKELLEFLDQLIEEREGNANGYFCDKNGEKVSSTSEIRFLSYKNTDTRFDFEIQLDSDNGVFNASSYTYTVGDNKLYLGPNTRGNETIILRLNKNELFIQEKFLRHHKGTPIVKETQRHYRFEDGLLTVENLYYVNGKLQSQNNWHLK